MTGDATGRPNQAQQRRNPVWRWVAAALAVLAVALALFWWNAHNRGPEYGVAIDAAAPALNFTLPSSLNKPVSLADYRGKVVLLYFGYTTCPDVCPTTLNDLKQAVQELGDQRDKVQVLFVSVDPERDTAQRLAAFLKYFDPSFVGLTGSVADIEAIASQYGVFFQKNMAQSATDYLVDHTSAVLVINPDGYLRAMFPYGTSGKQIASDVRRMIR